MPLAQPTTAAADALSPASSKVSSLFDLIRKMQAYGDDPSPYFHMIAKNLLQHLQEEAFPFVVYNRMEAEKAAKQEDYYIWDNLCHLVAQELNIPYTSPEKIIAFPQ